MLYLVAALMLITALVMLQIAKKKSASSERTQEASTDKANAKRFASVKLGCDRHACASARSMRNQVFLAREAPALPLAACDASHCQCRYTKTSDRRATGGRRAIDIGIQPLIFDGTEHREDDRRAS